MSNSTVIGAVLAGGRSARLGYPKACVELAGRPLISYAIGCFADAGLESVVVAKRSSTLPAEITRDHRVLFEPERPTHPLLGVLTALESTNGGSVLVLGCDMPFVPAALLVELSLKSGPIVVPSVGGFLQPLCALYRSEVTDQIREAVEKGRSATEVIISSSPTVLTEAELAHFGEPNVIFADIDTEDDLLHARDIGGL